MDRPARCSSPSCPPRPAPRSWRAPAHASPRVCASPTTTSDCASVRLQILHQRRGKLLLARLELAARLHPRPAPCQRPRKPLHLAGLHMQPMIGLGRRVRRSRSPRRRSAASLLSAPDAAAAQTPACTCGIPEIPTTENLHPATAQPSPSRSRTRVSTGCPKAICAPAYTLSRFTASHWYHLACGYTFRNSCICATNEGDEVAPLSTRNPAPPLAFCACDSHPQAVQNLPASFAFRPGRYWSASGPGHTSSARSPG